ncbi:MAG: hypothetical protein ACLGIP_18155, partial [Alphaproteobacteria bacterium]
EGSAGEAEMSKDINDAAQQMIDALYGMEAADGFGALTAATATAVAGYMHGWGRSQAEAEFLLEEMHTETITRLREIWGTVRRNDC